MNSDFVIY